MKDPIDGIGTDKQARDPVTGQYAYDGGFGRTCACGHSLGEHLNGGFDCIAHNLIRASGYQSAASCDCVHFRPRRRAADLAVRGHEAEWLRVGRSMAEAHRSAGADAAASIGRVVNELRAAHPKAPPHAAYLVGLAYGKEWETIDWMGEAFLPLWRGDIEATGADV